MKAFLVLLVLVLFSEAFAAENFKEWKEKYGKDYDGKEKANETKAEETYNENAKTVEAHNSDPNRTYDQKLNSRSDKTAEERKNLKGYRNDDTIKKKVKSIEPKKVREAYLKKNKKAEKSTNSKTTTTTVKYTVPSLPKNFEYKRLPVKDQGACGSCWAVSVSTQLEYLEQNSSKVANPKAKYLSQQMLLDCTDPSANSCSGGVPVYALDYAVKNGIVGGDGYDYVKRQTPCRHDKSKNLYQPKNVEACYAELKGNHTFLQESVYVLGPITVAIDTSGGFDYYSSGVYSSKTCSNLKSAVDHAVVITGWGETEQGLKYWVIQNSWGTDWGMNGYIHFIRGTNNCGVENAVHALCPARKM